MRLLGRKRRDAEALELLAAPPSRERQQAPITRPSSAEQPQGRQPADLRPLTLAERLTFIEVLNTCRGGDTGRLPSERLSNLRCRSSDDAAADEHITLRLDGNEAHILVNSDVAKHFVYERVADIAALLNFSARRSNWTGDLELNLGDGGRAGQLSFCLHEPGLLIPDSYFLSSAGYEVWRNHYALSRSWDERAPKVLWRGATTGVHGPGWQDLQRSKLCKVVANASNSLHFDVGFSAVVQKRSDTEEAEISAAGFMRPRVEAFDFNKFKYHIDVDGNSNSWPGLFLKLLSGGLVFKVDSPMGYRQWYYSRMKPWLHYIPVDAEMSNLEEAVDWALRNDDRAREIALAGRSLAEGMRLETEVEFAVSVMENALWRSGSGRLTR